MSILKIDTANLIVKDNKEVVKIAKNIAECCTDTQLKRVSDRHFHNKNIHTQRSFMNVCVVDNIIINPHCSLHGQGLQYLVCFMSVCLFVNRQCTLTAQTQRHCLDRKISNDRSTIAKHSR